MHAPHPWLAAGPSTRQTQPTTRRRAIGDWLTERRLLEILDAFVLGVLLATFLFP